MHTQPNPMCTRPLPHLTLLYLHLPTTTTTTITHLSLITTTIRAPCLTPPSNQPTPPYPNPPMLVPVLPAYPTFLYFLPTTTTTTTTTTTSLLPHYHNNKKQQASRLTPTPNLPHCTPPRPVLPHLTCLCAPYSSPRPVSCSVE
ncbi:hypothetical protein Pmani_024072 [Petrolisthes manimaculis]|uniref:Uncharacterized protein n=1 Tax=Petrolisthes manimaculis TaxID=1843537 RepID=A0AAE1P9Y6_9EUCA|nr:hypothetical protein Pmani_024072 [Petrolisthes manimaculis]